MLVTPIYVFMIIHINLQMQLFLKLVSTYRVFLKAEFTSVLKKKFFPSSLFLPLSPFIRPSTHPVHSHSSNIKHTVVYSEKTCSHAYVLYAEFPAHKHNWQSLFISLFILLKIIFYIHSSQYKCVYMFIYVRYTYIHIISSFCLSTKG